MKRRKFIIGLAGSAALPLAAYAQQKMHLFRLQEGEHDRTRTQAEYFSKRFRCLWLMADACEHLRTVMWWAREDSNLQPDRYERSARELLFSLRSGCFMNCFLERGTFCSTQGNNLISCFTNSPVTIGSLFSVLSASLSLIASA